MPKKKKYLILGITVLALSGGAIIGFQHPNLFSMNNSPTKSISSKEQQIEDLKKHEKEIEDFVKSQSPKVDSVQFDWDSMKVGQVGNGTPQGGGYMLTLRGKVNHNEQTKFMVGFSLENGNSTPKEFGIYEMQPIRIYRDGGWYYFDE